MFPPLPETGNSHKRRESCCGVNGQLSDIPLGILAWAPVSYQVARTCHPIHFKMLANTDQTKIVSLANISMSAKKLQNGR